MLSLKKILTHLINKIPSKKLFEYYFSKINKTNIGIIVSLHRVTDSKMYSDPSDFNEFIEIRNTKLEEVLVNLKKLNVEFISLKEVKEYLEGKKKPKNPLVHISFDDGYRDNYTQAFPLFERHKIPFSIFIASDFINNKHPFLWWYIIDDLIKRGKPISFDKYNFSITLKDYATKDKKVMFEQFRTFILENADMDRNYFEQQLIPDTEGNPLYRIPEMMNWDELNIMLSSGLCEVGIHTKSHPRFSNICNFNIIKEITTCKEAIQTHTGITAEHFAYPYGSLQDIGSTDGLKEILADCGIQLAFTTIEDELNNETDKLFIPRVFLNNTATMYTLKSRLNGSYQRGIKIYGPLK